MATPQANPKRFPSPKTLLIALVTGALALVAILGFSGQSNPKDKAPLQTVSVTRGDIVKSVATTGRVVPNFEVEIKGKASGKIIQLPYDVSDTVKEGELLVRLDPIDESRQVSQASASLAGVESRMVQTRLNLQVAQQNLATNIARARADLHAAEMRAREAEAKKVRLEELIKSRYISQEEYETGLADAAQGQSALENARVRLQELQTQEIALKAQAQDLNIAAAEAQGQRVALASSQQRLSETQIYAPISGVITSRQGQIGQIVSSGISNVSGGTTIMTLADLSRIFVLASVDESDIGQVHENQPVTITVDAYPGKTFAGKVLRISPKGVEESNVVTFEVKIEVLDPNNQLLKPEMTANVEILIDRKENVLTLPLEAIITHNDQSFVRVLDTSSQKPKRIRVTTGLTNGSKVEIIRGLKAGDKVLIGQKEMRSRWRKDGQGGGGQGGNMRGQRMMMRSFGGRR